MKKVNIILSIYGTLRRQWEKGEDRIMVERFPKLMKNININIKKLTNSNLDDLKEIHTKSHYETVERQNLESGKKEVTCHIHRVLKVEADFSTNLETRK